MDVLENWCSALRWRRVIGRAYGSAIVGDLAAGRSDALCSAAAVTAERAHAHGAPTPTMRSESNDELYAALAANMLDAVIDDSPIAAHFAYAISGLALAGALPDTDASYAIMVRKSNHALRDAINAALAAMELDGTLARLSSQQK